MMKRRTWEKSCTVFLLFVATATVAFAQFTTLANFDGADGANPFYMSLVQGIDGNFYGTTADGGLGTCTGLYSPGCGTVFKVSSSGQLISVYSFCRQAACPDGYYPYAGLALGTDGNFYGTAAQGGANGFGTVFKLSVNGLFTVLHSFSGIDGGYPQGGLIQVTDGNFYGTTTQGGTNNGGTVFKMTPEGVLTTLHSFCLETKCGDGAYPMAGLVEGTDGNFYGTTTWGGNPTCDCGTVFKIASNGTFTLVHSFHSTDGGYPYAALLQGSNGNLYGTARGFANSQCCGTIFRVAANGVLTTLYSFCAKSSCGDGSYPTGQLIEATDGRLYGTTQFGGLDIPDYCIYGCGTVFELTAQGHLTTLHKFKPGDGGAPSGGLLQGTNGTLYGTSEEYGGYDRGTVFSLSNNLEPFVAFVHPYGRIGQTGGILGQGFTGTTSVSLNGIPASFKVVSDTFITATVPPGATTGIVTVVTPSGTLTSNVPFRVLR